MLTVPVWNILVCNAGGDIEHDDTALSVDVVTIAETTELLLTGSIPDIKLELTQVLSRISMPSTSLSSRFAGRWWTYGGESERVNLNSQSGDILLLELTSQVTLDEGGL